jgi:hypothetical protein
VVPFEHFGRQAPAMPVEIWFEKAATAAEDNRIAILERPVMAALYDGMTIVTAAHRGALPSARSPAADQMP